MVPLQQNWKTHWDYILRETNYFPFCRFLSRHDMTKDIEDVEKIYNPFLSIDKWVQTKNATVYNWIPMKSYD